MPSSTPIIATPDALADLAARAGVSEAIGLDTEFLRERTYRAEIEAATIERCAERAKCAFDDRPNSRSGHHSEMDWTDGYRDGTRAAEAAIRNLKGQTS